MEIVSIPRRINFQTCKECGSKLSFEIKKGKKMIGDECYECRYDDRPFGNCRTNQGPCTCQYVDCEYLYITCNECMWLKCSGCKKKMEKNEYYWKNEEKYCCVCFRARADNQ